jgi:bifunctional non-homologous end joining protein LigD
MLLRELQRSSISSISAGLTRSVPLRPTFIRPQIPSSTNTPPEGPDWLHEPKFDGYRFQIVKDGNLIRLRSRSGADYSDRLPLMVAAFSKLPFRDAVLDGETLPH